jgi:divalent metal cation (Fe/Co/Zn/Cd) transporter
MNPSALSKSNYAAASGDLLFVSFACFSLFVMWVLRKTPVVGYISPAISIFVAVYLTIGCIKRIKTSLNELTDKTLPEEQQMQILKVLTRYFDSYTQVYSIDSRRVGEITRIEINLSFEDNTTVEDVINLQNQMNDELDSQLGNCILKLTVGDGKEKRDNKACP